MPPCYDISYTVLPSQYQCVGQLDANRPVPLRLTSGLQTFIGPFSKQGPFKLNMIAVCRCLVDPKFNFAGLLRAILRDEYMAWIKVYSTFV